MLHLDDLMMAETLAEGGMLGSLSGALYLLGGAFWLWMLLHCLRNDPERFVWLWVLLFVNVPFAMGPVGMVAPLGAVVYFLIRWLPARQGPGGSQPFKSWTRGRELQRLEAATRQIGNAHQFVQYGDALRDVGRNEPAAVAYDRALEKDPQSLPALWGKAVVLLNQQLYEDARGPLRQVLDIDPSYKFGDVSLAYARTLVKLEDPTAREFLDQHVRRWKQPEALYLLAELLVEAGAYVPARSHLESILLDLRAAPSFFVRQNRTWKNKAQRLLSKLPAE